MDGKIPKTTLVAVDGKPASKDMMVTVDSMKVPPAFPASKNMAVTTVDSKKAPPAPASPGVQLVSSWALYYAIFYGACALHNLYGHVTCDQSHWWTSCYYLYGAAGDEAGKLEVATLWCSVAQAATAVLALLLACRSRRITLATAVAFVALAIAAANHCLVARIYGLFLAAYPGDALLIVTVTVTVAAIILTLLGFALLFLEPTAHDANANAIAIAQHKMDQ